MQPSKQITAKKGPWTEDDVRRLRLLANANISADSIARFLGRSRASVTLKARWLKLALVQKNKVTVETNRSGTRSRNGRLVELGLKAKGRS